jgi:hypothetical protein
MPPRLRLTPSQLAGVIQVVVAASLAGFLVVAIWRFILIAERLPGGANRYIYLPIAMVAFLAMAVWRVVVGIRRLRNELRDRDRPHLELD